jgi:TolA-binding protein
MLVNLQKTMLDQSFYADRPNMEFVQPEKEADIQLSSVLQFEETENPVEQESTMSDSQVVSPESRLLDSFPLDEGRIAINANDERLTVYPVNLSAQSKGLIRAINKDILKPEDKKNKQTVFGVIPQIGDACTVIVHRGANNLLDYLWRYNRVHTTKRFFYTLMDPNDISLVNIVNVNYDFPAEANILILYLGFEYKKGILMKNSAFIKSFPIQTASNLFTNRDEIYSKLMLEQDEAQLPNPQFIILAGENSKNDDVTYFQNKFPKSEVSRIFFKNMLVGEDAPDPITEEDLAEYAIPIALAWKSMDSGNKKFINTNFLQKKIIEGQKIFKLAWHGFIILFLLFFYTSYATKNFLVLNNELAHLKKSNVMLESEYRSYKSKVESNMAGLLSVASLQGQQQKVLELLKGKNEWGYVLNILANSVANHPMSWIVNLKSEKETFTIIGKTTKRTNILAFSQLFPEGKILKVTNEMVGKNLIWNFEMSFAYPKMETILKEQAASMPQTKENTPPTKEVTPVGKENVTPPAKTTLAQMKTPPAKANVTTPQAKTLPAKPKVPPAKVNPVPAKENTATAAVKSNKKIVSQPAPVSNPKPTQEVKKAVKAPTTEKKPAPTVQPITTTKSAPAQRPTATVTKPQITKQVTSAPPVVKAQTQKAVTKQTTPTPKLSQPTPKKPATVENSFVDNTKPDEAVDKGSVDFEKIRSEYDNDKNEDVLAKTRQFIQKYPNHPYAYISKYMMAESMYMLNDYKGAIPIFDQIIAENKKKTADAYYMKGNCYLALKDTIRAKQNFRFVMENYPQSDVAKKARKKMEVLP